jgi:NAD(P)-dependent dehydrogenase (short-subunit alcohol dehydrogenase family)
VESLEGKTILITGASRGIGAAIAQAVGRAGANVIAHYGTYRDGAVETLRDIPDERTFLVSCDLSVPNSARRLWSESISWRGRIDVVVLNAAVNIETPFEGSNEQWDAGWNSTLQVNVLANAELLKEAVNHFVMSGGGVVIGLSSWSAQQGSRIPELSAYAASKAAVKAMVQTVARNYAAKGVLGYVIAPGVVKTRMADQAALMRGGETALKNGLALGELVPPEELAELVVFLSSGRTRHLTGATFDVNGASYIR